MDYLISQFADDTSIALNNTEGCLEALFNTLENFTKVSGLKINKDKSEILMLGICTLWDIPKKYRNLVKTEVKILGLQIGNSVKQNIEVNYRKAIEKIKANIAIWNSRHMSLAGKISITKSMLTSQLVYCMTNLPPPPEHMWKQIEQLIYGFLSNNKPEKMKRNTLIGPYDKGGFQMIDIRTQHIAINATWMVKLINHAGMWKERVLEQLPEVDYRYLMRCNLAAKDLPPIMKKDQLWGNIWECWCKINFRDDLNQPDEIYNQALWLNSLIRINGKPALWKNWIKANIMWVNDLIDDNHPGHMMHHHMVEKKYKIKIPFTEYYGLLQAMPKEWHILLRAPTDYNLNEVEDYKIIDELDDAKTPTKLIYNHLIKKKFLPPHSKAEKWNMELHSTLDLSEFLSNLERSRTATINNKLRSFNYNFFIRNIPYQARLYKMNIKSNPLCNKCQVKEDILHLYWSCPNAQRLWERLKQLLTDSGINTTNWSQELCLFGLNLENRSKQTKLLISILCLLTKHFIHLNKCNEGTGTPIELLYYIRGTYNIEKEIAKRNGTVSKIAKKWTTIIQKLEKKCGNQES